MPNYQRIYQGAIVKDILTSQLEATDDDIDSERPFYYDILFEKTEEKLLMKVGMLSEEKFNLFLKNITIIKEHILKSIDETEKKIEENTQLKESKVSTGMVLNEVKGFKQTFSEILSMFSECINPEVLMDDQIYKMYKASYKEELQKDDYYHLFKELLNINHPLVKDYADVLLLSEKRKENRKIRKVLKKNKTLLKMMLLKREITSDKFSTEMSNVMMQLDKFKGPKFFFEHRLYYVYRSMPIEYIRNIIREFIEYKVAGLLYKVSLDLLLPVFKKIIEYNDYKVKKNLQRNLTANSSLSTPQQRLTSLLEQNLSTLKIGGMILPDSKSKEPQQKEHGLAINK